MRADVSDGNSIPNLIERAREGDREAFEELVSPLRENLLNRICSKIGAGLREELSPDDVLQETQLRALRSIAKFRWQGDQSLRVWLEAIANNVILQSAKRHSRRREYRIDRDPSSPDVSPSRHERRNERFDRLKKSIDDLSPDYRTVIQLSRIEGLKVREIAERMGRSPSAVKNLLFKATKKLKDSFGDTESLSLPDRHLGESGTDE